MACDGLRWLNIYSNGSAFHCLLSCQAREFVSTSPSSTILPHMKVYDGTFTAAQSDLPKHAYRGSFSLKCAEQANVHDGMDQMFSVSLCVALGVLIAVIRLTTLHVTFPKVKAVRALPTRRLAWRVDMYFAALTALRFRDVLHDKHYLMVLVQNGLSQRHQNRLDRCVCSLPFRLPQIGNSSLESSTCPDIDARAGETRVEHL